MDTILYFYKKRGLEKPEIEPVGLKTYLLIRIGLDVGEEQWFGHKLEQILPVSHDASHIAIPAEGGKPWAFLWHPWRAFQHRREAKERQRREQAQRRVWEQQEARGLAVRKEFIAQVGQMIQRLALEVGELAGGLGDCSCVYEDSLRKALIEETKGAGGQPQNGQRPWEEGQESWYGQLDRSEHEKVGSEREAQRQQKTERILQALWKKDFPVAEFQGYAQEIWIEQLFRHATLPHFIILGMSTALFPVIEAYAGRMKSLRWILTEAEYVEELTGFVEDFYTEYGLAIELQLLQDGAALKRLRFFCKEAVNIVDLTGEAYMAVSTVPEGSIWLDLFAVEEKKRRILVRDKKITYVSMKEIWKIAQKRCNCPVLP